MTEPTLVIVSGPPGSGKTTLAHEVARRMPCPVISRDEIKEGIVHARGGLRPEWGGPVSKLTLETFFATLRLLLEAGVSVVAEAAFQDQLWRPDIEPLAEISCVRIIHCKVDARVIRARLEERLGETDRAAHPDSELIEAIDSGKVSLDAFESIALYAPSIKVDTTDGYDPSLDEIVAFINAE